MGMSAGPGFGPTSILDLDWAHLARTSASRLADRRPLSTRAVQRPLWQRATDDWMVMSTQMDFERCGKERGRGAGAHLHHRRYGCGVFQWPLNDSDVLDKGGETI